MGSKSSAPAAPDYSSVAAADTQAAQLQYNLGQQQFQFAQNQFNQVWPYAQQYLQSQTQAQQASLATAQQQQDFYNTTFKPLEQQFATTAANYNSPANASQNAGTAMADVSNTFEQQRSSALSSLESYGIDPSQTRFGALDLSTRISQAAASAAAGTQSRLNTQATGLALQGEAINMGQGIQNNVAQAYSTATNAGQSGINAANQTGNSATSGMSGSSALFGGGTAANAASASALNLGYNNQLSSANMNMQSTSNMMSGIGSLAGMGLTAALML